MIRKTALDRREFIKKASETSIVGTASVATGTGSASAAYEYEVSIISAGPSYDYIIGTSDSVINKGSDAEGNDTDAGGYALGTVFGDNVDSYVHSGRIDEVSIDDGSNGLSLSFPSGSNELHLFASGSREWNYTIRATGSISKGSDADPGDTDNGDWVTGTVVNNGTDSYTYTGNTGDMELEEVSVYGTL